MMGFSFKVYTLSEELEKKQIFLKIEETATVQTSEVGTLDYTKKRREKLNY